jgi:hypothetical protein
MSSTNINDTDSIHSSQSDADDVYSSQSDTGSTHSSQSEADSICSVQNDPPSEVKLMIHNQFPGIELVSPVYAGEGVTCYLSPDQSVNTGSTMQAYFSVDLEQDESINALLCKLNRSDIAEFDEHEKTCIQLVIFWKVDKFKRFLVNTYLIEHDGSRVWNRDMLMELAKNEKLFDMKYYHVEETWLIHDNIALKINLNITREEGCCNLEINISEASIKDDTQRPWYFDMDR